MTKSIIPREAIEFEEFDCFGIPNNAVTAGVFFHPLVLPETDIHWKLSPTIKVTVKNDEEVFVHGIERKTVNIHRGDSFDAFFLAESPERIFAILDDSFIFLPKEAVEIFTAPAG